VKNSLQRITVEDVRTALSINYRERSELSPSNSADSTPAAVLVPLFEQAGKLTTLLTRRREDLTHHPGQISFPGGRPEPEDQSPVATALRESHEEIGLTPDSVEIVGRLSDIEIPITGFTVTPFVGVIKQPLPKLVINPNEVSELLTITLEELYSGKTYRDIQVRGVKVKARAYQSGDHMVWGATARILQLLFSALAEQ